MDGYGLAWTIYGLGAVGCAMAAFLLFRRFGREWAIFFFVSVLALLLTPYAVDAEQMLMAPAIFFIVFEGLTEGLEAVMPIIMVVSGVWLAGLVISLLVQLVTRRFSRGSAGHTASASRQRETSKRETVYREARQEEDHTDEDDLPDHTIPLRAER
ncbi:hypothetical protein ACSV5M_07580 [Cellvibrio sp. ARAG 10.3]|uniref:hypothetical protein n=1 Tax=Cellvibrio sp. ARAG 10.3 TaxID=3451358 RepID=UPI003F489182